MEKNMEIIISLIRIIEVLLPNYLIKVFSFHRTKKYYIKI